MTSDHEHRCSFIPEGIHIYRAKHFLDNSQWPWCLVIARLATQKDLEENHYLDEEGDTIWQTVVGITHCPYCGEPLENQSQESEQLEADFYHADFTGWHSKRM